MQFLQSLLIVYVCFMIQNGSSLKTIRTAWSIRSFCKVNNDLAIYSSTGDSQQPEELVGKSSSGKGFGKEKVFEKGPEPEPEKGTKTYDLQAKRGVPEYNIFIRPTNGTDVEWIPVGSMVGM